MNTHASHQAVEAVWRIESARLIGGLVRMVRDVALAEDLAQEALESALEHWPETGVPENPGAWLMATAKNRALDQLRRQQMLVRKHQGMELEQAETLETPDFEARLDDEVGDDLLRLILIACHPVLSKEARVALTLRLLGGLSALTFTLLKISRVCRYPSHWGLEDPLGDRLSSIILDSVSWCSSGMHLDRTRPKPPGVARCCSVH